MTEQTEVCLCVRLDWARLDKLPWSLGHIRLGFKKLLTKQFILLLDDFIFDILPPPHSGRNEAFLCIFEKNIFLDILDESKNILENRIFDQTSF
jgi:hypothetical protein